jgi:predicted transcriptional regulator
MKEKPNKSVFLKYFGDTPQLRVIDFMIENHFFDFPLTEIARESNVSYNSLKSFVDYFVENGLFIITRKIGKSDYYKLNIENVFVQNLIKLDWSLTKLNSLGLINSSSKKELLNSFKA